MPLAVLMPRAAPAIGPRPARAIFRATPARECDGVAAGMWRLDRSERSRRPDGRAVFSATRVILPRAVCAVVVPFSTPRRRGAIMRRSDPVPDQAQAGTTRAAEDARPAVVAGGWEGRPARGVLGRARPLGPRLDRDRRGGLASGLALRPPGSAAPRSGDAEAHADRPTYRPADLSDDGPGHPRARPTTPPVMAGPDPAMHPPVEAAPAKRRCAGQSRA